MGRPDFIRAEHTKIKDETKVILGEQHSTLNQKGDPIQGALTEWLELRTTVQTPFQRNFQNPNRGSLPLNILESEHISKGWEMCFVKDPTDESLHG